MNLLSIIYQLFDLAIRTFRQHQQRTLSGRSRRRKSTFAATCGFEQLEARRVLAVAAVADGFELTVTASGASDFTISTIEDSGQQEVQVFDNNFNQPVQIVDENGNPDFVPAEALSRLTVIGGELQNTIIIDASQFENLQDGGTFGLTVDGGDGDDTIMVNAFPPNSSVNGGNDDDIITITGTSGGVVDGGDGDDEITGSSGDDILVGGDGNDTIHGLDGEDTLRGGEDDDVLLGGDDADLLEGEGGNDTLTGGEGDDQLDGGSGVNTQLETDPTVLEISVQIDSSGNGEVLFDGRDQLTNIEFVDLTGDESDEEFDLSLFDGIEARINGGGGDDLIIGSDRSDVLDGGEGDDEIRAGEGDDLVIGGPGEDLLLGESGNDTLHGELLDLTNAGDADEIRGGEGNDEIFGGGGDDRIEGGEGDDSISGEGGEDTILGGEGDDTIDGGDDADDIDGGLGDDEIDAGAGDDVVVGGPNDAGFFGSDQDTIRGGPGRDTLSGGDDDDQIDGQEDDDILSGDEGDDTLIGGPGNDTLGASGGNEELRGGTGADRYAFSNDADNVVITEVEESADVRDIVDFSAVSASTPVTIAPDANESAVYGNTSITFLQTLIEEYIGTPGDDQITPQHLVIAVIDGGEGNDTLSAGDGPDEVILIGGPGDDTLVGSDATNQERLEGGTGDDSLEGGGGPDDVLVGGQDNDTYIFTDLNEVAQVDERDGGGDQDILDFSQLTGGGGVQVSLLSSGTIATLSRDGSGTGVVTGASATAGPNVENVRGSDFDDVIEGNNANNRLSGGDGNDELFGFSGDDELFGEDDDDILEGGADNDVIDGGEGSDFVSVRDSTDPTVVILAAPGMTGTTEGTSIGNDSIDSTIENVFGSASVDSITGNVAANHILGGLGNDTIVGGAGDDILDGGEGNDRLDGEQGNDELIGGPDDDRLNGGGDDDRLLGGTGNDEYRFGTPGGINDEELDTIIETGGLDDERDSLNFSAIFAGRAIPPNPLLRVDLVGANIAVHEDRRVAFFTEGTNSQIEDVIGSEFDDTISGNDRRNNLAGGMGNDVISGLGDIDLLVGGEDDDELIAGDGNGSEPGGDSLSGGSGRDILRGGPDNDILNGGANEDILSGGLEDDVLDGEGADDILLGDGGNDSLTGGSGSDTFIGGGGNDTFTDAKVDIAVSENIDSADPIVVGGTVVYEILVDNLGSGEDVANDVTVQGNFSGRIDGPDDTRIIGTEFINPLTGAPTGVFVLPLLAGERFFSPVGTGIQPGFGFNTVSANAVVEQEELNPEDNELSESTLVIAPPGNRVPIRTPRRSNGEEVGVLKNEVEDTVTLVGVGSDQPNGPGAITLDVDSDGIKTQVEVPATYSSDGDVASIESFNSLVISLAQKAIQQTHGTRAAAGFVENGDQVEVRFDAALISTIKAREGALIDLLHGIILGPFAPIGTADTSSFAIELPETLFNPEIGSRLELNVDFGDGSSQQIDVSLDDVANSTINVEHNFELPGNFNPTISGLIFNADGSLSEFNFQTTGTEVVVNEARQVTTIDLTDDGIANDTVENFRVEENQIIADVNGNSTTLGQANTPRRIVVLTDDPVPFNDETIDIINGSGLNGLGLNVNFEITTGSGADEILGSDGEDIIIGGSRDDMIFGGGGIDQIFGDFGNDQLFGGDGDDTIFGGGGSDVLNGEAGNDKLNGGRGSDTNLGGEGNDIFVSDDDSLDVARVNDPNRPMDTNDGGGGNDTFKIDVESFNDISLIESAGVISALQFAGPGSTFRDTARDELADIEEFVANVIGPNGALNVFINPGTYADLDSINFIGGALNDRVNKAPGANVGVSFNAGEGDNFFGGNNPALAGGNDKVTGGSGNDNFSTGGGNDVINAGAGNNTVNAGAGDDTYVFEFNVEGDIPAGETNIAETVIGGSDTIEFRNQGNGSDSVTFDLSDGGDQQVTSNHVVDLASTTAIENLSVSANTSANITGNQGDNTYSVTASQDTTVFLSSELENASLVFDDGGMGDDQLNLSFEVDGDIQDSGQIVPIDFFTSPNSGDILRNAGSAVTVNFAQAVRAVSIDLDLLDIDQIVDVNDNTFRFEGLTPSFTGSDFDDVVQVDGALMPRDLKGGAGNDEITIDAKESAVTRFEDGETSVFEIAGFSTITVSEFETINVVNEGVAGPLEFTFGDTDDDARLDLKTILNLGDETTSVFELLNLGGTEGIFLRDETIVVDGAGGTNRITLDVLGLVASQTANEVQIAGLPPIILNNFDEIILENRGFEEDTSDPCLDHPLFPSDVNFVGDITVSLVEDDVFVNGDAENNGIRIIADDRGIVAIPVGDTTINGSAGDFVIFAGVNELPGDLTIESMGDGDDFLCITDIRVTRQTDIVTDAGNDVVIINNVDFDLLADIDVGFGDDIVELSGTTADIATRVSLGDGDDLFNGSESRDIVSGGDGNDTINGAGGDDEITGDGGADIQRGGGGNDTFIWNNGDGPDDNFGETGEDFFVFGGSETGGDDLRVTPASDLGEAGDGTHPSADFDLTRVAPSAFTIEVSGVENIQVDGLGGDDRLDASTVPAGLIASVTLTGGIGNDVLSGSQGIDSLFGGDGDDIIIGNRGNDFGFGEGLPGFEVPEDPGDDRFIWNNGDGADNFFGDEGDDTFEFNGAEDAADVISITPGGDDGDFLSADALGQSFDLTRIDPSAFTIETQTIEAFEVNGLGGDDQIDASTLQASAIDLTFAGGNGDDDFVIADLIDKVIDGNDGLDRILGRGNDSILDFDEAVDNAIANITQIELSPNESNSIILDPISLERVAGDQTELVLRADSDDEIEVGEGWQSGTPETIDGLFHQVLVLGDSTLRVSSGRPFQNVLASSDVNDDGRISSLDALLVINTLLSAGTSPVPLGQDRPTSGVSNFLFQDVNGDGQVSAFDALLIINEITSQRQMLGSSESIVRVNASPISISNEPNQEEESALQIPIQDIDSQRLF